jgi:putative N-acetylmannosamine-6-phosphate epimerase
VSPLTFTELNGLLEANVLTIIATCRRRQVTDMNHLIGDDKYDSLITMTMINVK